MMNATPNYPRRLGRNRHHDDGPCYNALPDRLCSLLKISPLFQTPNFFTMLLSMNSTNMTTILSLWSNNHSYFIGEIIMIIVLVFLLLLILKDICCCCCNTKMTPSFMPSLMA